MKKIILLVMLLSPGLPVLAGGDEDIASVFQAGASGIQVSSSGVVIRILPDDTSGSRHQRFIIRLSSGQTLLMSHNIDLAPRITTLNIGDSIEFYGEYMWNTRGGVIHWTHRDPNGRHPGGWIVHHGVRYE